MRKKYVLAVALALLFVALMGFILPALFSAASTEAVLLGVTIIIVSVPLAYFMGKKPVN